MRIKILFDVDFGWADTLPQGDSLDVIHLVKAVMTQSRTTDKLRIRLTRVNTLSNDFAISVHALNIHKCAK